MINLVNYSGQGNLVQLLKENSKMSTTSTPFHGSSSVKKKSSFGYKNYYISNSYHLVKNSIKTSASLDRSFEVVSNNAL